MKKDLQFGYVELIERKYDEHGYETTRSIREIPALISDLHIPVDVDRLPDGFHLYQTRGTDWSEEPSPEEMIAMCEEHRASLANHLTDEHYERLKAVVLEDEDCATDEYYELRSELNNALCDDDAPRIEGFEITMNVGVWVNFWQSVIIKEDINDIRKELGVKEPLEIDIETWYADSDATDPIWEEFMQKYND